MSVRAAVKKYGIVGDAAGDLTRKVLSCPVFDLSGIFQSVLSGMADLYKKKAAAGAVTVTEMGLDNMGPPPFSVCLLELGPVQVNEVWYSRAILEDGDRFVCFMSKACSKAAVVGREGASHWRLCEAVARQIINDRKRVSVTRVDQPRRKPKTKGERSDVAYHVVKLKAGRTPERYGQLLARAERMAARQHQVRGHWKYNGTKWIESYKRGRGGIVEKDYRVDGAAR